jgi:hypothetical protein
MTNDPFEPIGRSGCTQAESVENAVESARFRESGFSANSDHPGPSDWTLRPERRRMCVSEVPDSAVVVAHQVLHPPLHFQFLCIFTKAISFHG